MSSLQMTSVEKLFKTIDALKSSFGVLSSGGVDSNGEEAQLFHRRKVEASLDAKDKMQHCRIISEWICSVAMRTTKDFPKLLGMALETLLACCDDDNADVRLVVDDCLNRSIRASMEGNLGRIQVELYKCIKKNGPARSLRTALTRFADMCHLIRPQKCRAYLVNLLSCFANIASRPEDLIQESLGSSLDKIFHVLGIFAADNEIKVLLQTFLPNLRSSSAVVRRTASSCLVAICRYSRKPRQFLGWLLVGLLELIIPVDDPAPSIPAILGTLLCFRNIVLHLASLMDSLALTADEAVVQGSVSSRGVVEQEHGPSEEQLLQMYECILFFIGHVDHNVVSTSLEALQQLLRTPPEPLVQHLVRHCVLCTRIYAADVAVITEHSRVAVVVGSVVSLSEEELDDPDTCSLGHRSSTTAEHSPDVASVAETSSVSSLSLHGEDSTKFSMLDGGACSYSGIQIGRCIDDGTCVAGNAGTLGRSKCKKNGVQSFDNFSDASEELTEDAGACLERPVVLLGNIGTFVGPQVPLHFCARLLASSFLLSGSVEGPRLLSDNLSRISIKTLALSCFSNILRLCPGVLRLPLHVEDFPDSSEQCLDDVLHFRKHVDPQVRGSVATVICNYISAVLRATGGDYDTWRGDACKRDTVAVELLLDYLNELLVDESAVTCRLALVASKPILMQLLNSALGKRALMLFKTVLNLAATPYWLVKVEVLELLSEVQFVVVAFLESLEDSLGGATRCDRTNFLCQNIALRIIVELLGDEDHRVCHQATTTLSKIIRNLFHERSDPVVQLGCQKMTELLGLARQQTRCAPMMHYQRPSGDFQRSLDLEASLSKVLHILVTTLDSSANKYLTVGCIRALSVLSQDFPVADFYHAWMPHIFVLPKCGIRRLSHNFNKIGSLVSEPSTTGVLPDVSEVRTCCNLLVHVLSFLEHTSVAFDLTAHNSCLHLGRNLFKGFVQKCLETSQKEKDVQALPETPWSFLGHKDIASMAKNLFTFLLRLLNICAHVLDGLCPVAPTPKSSLPSAPSLSPVKRKTKLVQEQQILGKTETEDKGAKKATTSSTSISLNVLGVSGLGAFYHSPHLMKLYEVIHGAHNSYCLTSDFHNDGRFPVLVRTVLEALADMLEVAAVPEMRLAAEEILCYLRSIMALEPKATVACVQQLLKALFGTNLTVGVDGSSDSDSDVSPVTFPSLSLGASFYDRSFTEPLAELARSLAPRSSVDSGDGVRRQSGSSTWLEHLKRKWEIKLPVVGSSARTALGTSAARVDRSDLASHIRLFEPLVIKALKIYTVTSSVALQCQVLHLLAQLVQLRVNYCLLDSDQIFIAFVTKQFEYIEGGQVPGAKFLVSSIFYFLVLLSYERYHSKPIIGVPKIIQLCDGLMASGQPVDTHVIPSLLPIVEDLFLVRGTLYKSEASKELQIQREVLVSMLFRVVHHFRVLDIFALILHEARQESKERWKKLSRQVVDVLLPVLVRQQVNLDSDEAFHVLQRLLAAASPSVFRPLDDLLRAMLAPPKDLSSPCHVQRWVCFVIAVLRLLLSQSKEEIVLNRLAELHLPLSVLTTSVLAEIPEARVELLPSDETVARFFLQVVGVVSEHIRRFSFSLHHVSRKSEVIFLAQLLAVLLLYVTHMFQSGSFRRVATTCMALARSRSDDGRYYTMSKVGSIFLELSTVFPTLTLQWCNVLVLVNSDCRIFWSAVLRTSLQRRQAPARYRFCGTSPEDPIVFCHEELLRKGGLMIFCDLVCEDFSDGERITWLIVDCIATLVELSMEPPVHDLICNVQRNPAASSLFLQAVSLHWERFCKPNTVLRLFSCLDGLHRSQSGALVVLLVERFLATPRLSISRLCASVICRRVEMLLAMAEDEEDRQQLQLEDVDKLLQAVRTSERKHQRLAALLAKLKNHLCPFAPAVPMEISNAALFSRASVNKVSFLEVVTQMCSKRPGVQDLALCANLLCCLDLEEILLVLGGSSMEALLAECLRRGASDFVELGDREDQHLHTLENSSGGVALFVAARRVLFRRLTDVVAFIICAESTKEGKGSCGEDSMNRQVDTEVLQNLLAATCSFFRAAHGNALLAEASVDDATAVVNFVVVAVEVLHRNLHRLPVWLFDALWFATTFEAVCAILEDFRFFCILNQNLQWTKSLVDGFFCAWNSVIEELPKISVDSCGAVKLSLVVASMEQKSYPEVPTFLEVPLHKVAVGLGRVQHIGRYVRIPPLVSKNFCPTEVVTEATELEDSSIPALPVELVVDEDVLRQFTFRANLLGWTSRQQFEETWMVLLGVLSSVSSNRSTESETRPDGELVHMACLALKSITALLLQSLLLPQVGNPCSGQFLHQPREKPLAYVHTRQGRKLLSIWQRVHQVQAEHPGTTLFQSKDEWLTVASVVRQNFRTRTYGHGQVSLEYLQGVLQSSSDRNFNESALCFVQRQKSLMSEGLDIHSCIHFFLELCSGWLLPTQQQQHARELPLLSEATRSVVMLSDIFTERSQFKWMLTSFSALLQTHPPEDEVVSQYMVLGICKAAAVLSMENDACDHVRKALEQSLKSTFLSTRILALQGVLYLLEAGATEAVVGIVPAICDYLVCYTPNRNNPGHASATSAVSFFLLENFQNQLMDAKYGGLLEHALDCITACDDCVPLMRDSVHRRLERLLLTGTVGKLSSDTLLKTAMDRMSHHNPSISMLALDLMLSCMYSDAGEDAAPPSPDVPDVCTLDPELLITAMEKVSFLFNRMKRGYPCEAKVIASVLPGLLLDFFPLSDVINKVIGEFISSHQPHPQLLAGIVFKIFGWAQRHSKHLLVQEWVLLSLSNFMQQSPMSVVVWSLTCFFISASSNPWLKAMYTFITTFPFVQKRMGMLEAVDFELFYLSGVDFYHQLTDAKDRQTFEATFAVVAQDNTPYHMLLQRIAAH